MLLAADWCHESGIPLFDALVAATASRRAACVLTADPDFRRVAQRVPVDFIR